jgi:hypothetical protein
MEKAIIIEKKSAPKTKVVKAVNLNPPGFKVINGEGGKEDVYERIISYVSDKFQSVETPCTQGVYNAIISRKLDRLIGYEFSIHYNTDNVVCRVEPVKKKEYVNTPTEEDRGISTIDFLIEDGGFCSVKAYPLRTDLSEVDRIKRAIDASDKICEGDLLCGLYPIVSYTKGIDGLTLSVSPKPAPVQV